MRKSLNFEPTGRRNPVIPGARCEGAGWWGGGGLHPEEERAQRPAGTQELGADT